LKKGSKIALVGSLQNRSYEDKDGVKRTVTDIVASEVEFLTTNRAEDEEQEVKPVKKERLSLQPVDSDNDLPF
jgi:single-strand DNA-binding protein